VNTAVVRAEGERRAALAEQNKAELALASTINGENTTVARIRAELAAARVDLEDPVVRAPADGYVTSLSLRPGQVIKPRDLAVVTFVNSEEYALAATFHQQVVGSIQAGDEAELALDDLPGRTLSATVKNINWGIPQGQVVASGELLDSTPVPHGRYFIQFKLDNDEGLTLPAGEAGAATIYTSRGRIWAPVRRVFFRWYTWLNYVITDMDVIGPRQ
jgi:multidrug resistance efflux pump